MNNEKQLDFPNNLKDSLKSLGQMVCVNQNFAAAMLYRLMFRHEKNISVLDKYSDQLLDGLAGIGSIYVKEDYKNFLQYLKTVVPSEYETHKRMFDEYTAEDDELRHGPQAERRESAAVGAGRGQTTQIHIPEIMRGFRAHPALNGGSRQDRDDRDEHVFHLLSLFFCHDAGFSDVRHRPADQLFDALHIAAAHGPGKFILKVGAAPMASVIFGLRKAVFGEIPLGFPNGMIRADAHGCDLIVWDPAAEEVTGH